MKTYADHTEELEKRIAALSVQPQDSCSFFCVRSDSLVGIRQCWYCAYGKFDRDEPDPKQTGYCRLTARQPT